MAEYRLVNDGGLDIDLNFNRYLFRGVVFLKVNDLIFRKRLMQSSWWFREVVLKNQRDFFNMNKRFQQMETDVPLRASLKRDHILMFGSPREISDRLKLEVEYLPNNQQPTHHEIYALITEISTINSKFTLDPQSRMALSLSDLQDRLARNSFKVTKSWGKYHIESKDGILLGMPFLAKEEQANNFFSEVISLLDDEERATGPKLSGFRAFEFIPMDPRMHESRSINFEKECLDAILSMKASGSLDEVDEDGEDWTKE